MGQRGTYQTKVKSKIMEFFKLNQNRAVSASDIIDYLNRQGYSTNPTTVYRYLSKMYESKLVIKYPDIDGEKSRYQYVEPEKDCSDHLHIQCIKCGELCHLDCDFMQGFENHLESEHGYEIKCQNSVLYGICSKCIDKDNKKI